MNALGRLARSPLLHFAVIGAVLYWVDASFFASTASDSKPVLVISSGEVEELVRDWSRTTRRPPGPEELSALIAGRVDDELLVREAYRLGWNRTDSVVRRRLIQNQRFIDPDTEASDEELLQRAYEQQMDRGDLVVRRRLMERMRMALGAAGRAREPDDAALQAYLDAHAEEFERPARVRLHHVYLSRDLRGESLGSDAAALGRRLRETSPGVEAALALGDPLLVPGSLPLWSERALAGRLGAEFARRAFEVEPGRWEGPVSSSYGLHFVWVVERESAYAPPLEDVRGRVRASWLGDRENEALRAALVELRDSVEVRVAPWPPREGS